MKQRFSNQAILITGAASGIGRSCAQQFAREAANVVLADKNLAKVKSLAEELDAAGGNVEWVACDVSSREQVEAMVARAQNVFGGLDVLVNSAGISGRHTPQGADFDEAWRMVMDINVRGTALSCHAAIPLMRARGGGAIVNLASVMGQVVHPPGLGLSDGFNPYAQSKGAVIQLTRDIAVHHAHEGVRANAVCPGFVQTPLTKAITENPELHAALARRHPLGRLGRPEEIASVISFLASQEASFVTGAAWMVDGGYTAI